MPPRPQTAVYKCIIPIKKPVLHLGTIYHSLFRKPRQTILRIPFLAWPEIDDAYLPCCLPTLMRAVYFPNHPTYVDAKKAAKAAKRAEKHISKLKGIEPEIREQSIDLLKVQQNLLQDFSKVTTQPPVLFGVYYLSLPQLVKYQTWVAEVLMQGLIYGNHEIFYGNEEAYAYAHEYGHLTARLWYSGVVLDELSKSVQVILYRIACDESLSHEEVDQLWQRFSKTNQYIIDLVKKFEPIEEIFATYIGLRFSPPKVRKAVKPLLKVELENRGWDKAYEAFAKACDGSNSPFWAAILLFEPVCRMIKQIDMDSVKFLEKFLEVQYVICMFYVSQGVTGNREELLYLNKEELEEMDEECTRLIEQSGIPCEVFVSVCETMRDIVIPRIYRLAEANMKNDLSGLEDTDLPSHPYLTLIGYHADKYVIPFFIDTKQEYEKYERNLADPRIRFVLESLRQQLSPLFRRNPQLTRYGEIVCPCAFDTECCGLKEDLQRLYKRLPKEVKKHLTPPHCDLD